MRKLIVFNQLSLDGFIADPSGDMSWAHKQDAEWNAFISGNAAGDCVLLFGRVTYEMMASWWPTTMALQSMPVVAERMNSLPKYIFSRTLTDVSWNNSRILKADVAAETRRLKEENGPDIMVFGSGSIVCQLAEEDLIDEYQFIVNPVVLGQGRAMFEGIKEKVFFKLSNSRVFMNGNVLLNYESLRPTPA